MLKGFLINMNIFFLLFILACPPLMVLITSYGFTRDPVNWRKWLPLFVLIFFLIAYSYNPQSIPDLTRYFQMLQDIQGLSFSNVNLYFNDSLYLKNFIFWIISNSKDVHILPAVATATVYGVSGYILCDTAENENMVKQITWYLLAMILAFPIIGIINNVRNVWAFALLAMGIYRDLLKKNRNLVTILLYILPCFIHSASIVIVFLRFICIFFSRLSNLFKILLLSLIPLLSLFIDLLYRISNKFPKYVSNFIITMHSYLYETNSQYAISISTSEVQKIEKIFAMVATMFILVMTYTLLKKGCKENQKYYSFVFLLGIIVLSLHVFIVPHYWRFFLLLMMLAYPVLFEFKKIYLNSDSFLKSNIIVINYYLFFCFSIIYGMADAWKSRGLIDIGNFVVSFTFNNIYVVIFTFFKGFFM